MNVGKICKVTSIVLFILDFLGSVSLGNALGGYDFNWSVFLYGILGGFILCLLIFALGEIIDRLECISELLYDLLKDMRTRTSVDAPKTVKNARDTQPPAHMWRCSFCGKLINQSPCPHCGNN